MIVVREKALQEFLNELIDRRPKTRKTPSSGGTSNKIFAEDSIELRLALLLLQEIRKNKPDFKQPHLEAWAQEIDRMIRIDGRSPERIAQVIRWAQSDHGDGSRWRGWAANILSAAKLREKFDVLEIRMGARRSRWDD